MTTNSAQQLIYQAALLIEEEQFDQALALLNDAIDLATTASRTIELIQARSLLGEILLNIEREGEAAEEFKAVLELSASDDIDSDQVREEVETAHHWLEELAHPEN
jgi:tetratricopeptide (TPR) repeat protein